MPLSANAKASLTARLTGRAVTKVGVSDPAVCEWKCRRSTDKSYPGDNRLISPKSPHRREVWHLDVGSSHPGAVFGPKGSAVRRLSGTRAGFRTSRDSSVPICRGRRIFEELCP